MRPTQAVINLSAIRHNVRQIRSTLAPDTRFIAVVKANAYGHGVIPVSRTLLGAGADWLAVANDVFAGFEHLRRDPDSS